MSLVHLARAAAAMAVIGIGLPSLTHAGDLVGGTTPQAVSQHHEHGGVAIDFTLAPALGALRAGGDALATVRISDARTGLPLSGVRPRAWIARRPSEMLATETECTDKVRALSGGLLSTRADVDLNSYRVLTLNHDKTISVINPQVAFGATKLENLIVLPAVGADWVLAKDRDRLFVSLPEADAVAVIDTVTRRLVATLSTGTGSRPHRVAIDERGRVWVGLDGVAAVAVIDAGAASADPSKLPLTRIETGSGLHHIVLPPESHYAFVSNSSANTVSVIDTASLTRKADVAVGAAPVALAFGAAARAVYVASLNDAAITVIDADRPLASARGEAPRRIDVGRGTVAIGFEPQGRFALVVNQIASQITVIDSADGHVVGQSSVVHEPDQVSFTERYAYVHALGSEKFSLLDVAELQHGRIAPLDIQAGRQRPDSEPAQIGAARMIVPTPEGNAVMVANAPDRTLYFYQEGMMAPMGTFSNYGRMPRGLLVLDHSLQERAPGTYSAAVRLPASGLFDVPVMLEQPRHIHCFAMALPRDPAAPVADNRVAVEVQRVGEPQPSVPRQRSVLRFSVTDAASGAPIEGLQDVQALVFEPPGVWQQRRQLRDAGRGVYEFDLVFPRAARYTVMLAIPSRGVHFADMAPKSVQVGVAAADDAVTATMKGTP